jgi:predicted RNA binding protein YcfA (HicA-like mRNA interferase family)
VRRFMAGILADRHARGSHRQFHHRQFHHAAKPGTVTVAGHPSIDIPPETLNNILKQAGLK